MKLSAKFFLAAVPCFWVLGCAAPPPYVPSTGVNSAPGRPTVYEDFGSPGRVAGIGIESQDVQSMTDKMIGDLLATPLFAHRNPPPRVIIDSEYFRNESSTRINKNIITDRLRVNLNRAARGRIIFVGRIYSDMVERERHLKRQAGDSGAPPVDRGTIPARQATLGGDYRLGGRITTIDAVDSRTGMASRTHQIIFEMVDLESGQIAWSGIYDFKKSARDDIIYR
ncbi:MAG: penicillin-binding protein activator LpoB [Nitrospinaceae bacterium]